MAEAGGWVDFGSTSRAAVSASGATAQDFTARPLTSATWTDLGALFGLPCGSIVRGC